MTTETRIEAAERLREILRLVPNPGIALAIFDAALAAERRAMANRILERIEARSLLLTDSVPQSVLDILDEEAAR